MITGKRDVIDEGRPNYALGLLESSGYDELLKAKIASEINEGTSDDIELIIQDLLLNQVDNWNNYRNKDIQRRLNIKC